MPSASDIAHGTGLSRETVQKHLKERKTTDYYNERTETLRGLTHNVLAELYKMGMQQQNVKALKVFMDYFKEDTIPKNTNINTQNNYIQINGTVLSQQAVQNLNIEQLNQIESIIESNI